MNEEMQSMGGRRYQKRVIGVWNWKYAVACRNCRWWTVWWLGKFLTLFKQELAAAAILSNLVMRYVDKWISMRWCYLLHRLLSSPFNVYHLNFLSDFAISAPPLRAARGDALAKALDFHLNMKLCMNKNYNSRIIVVVAAAAIIITRLFSAFIEF